MKARFRTMLAATLAAAAFTGLLFGSAATAADLCVNVPGTRPICIETPGGQDPLCEKRNPQGGAGDGEQDPLCPSGPSECISYGMFLAVDPMPAAPGGVTTHLARSHATAQAFAWQGFAYAQGDSDASTQRADVPPALGEGVVESSCHAMSYTDGFWQQNNARGTAETAWARVDLSSYGVPVSVSADVLRESGFASSGFIGGNSANVADVTVIVNGTPVVIPASAAPNTSIPLPGGLGTLYLNEQFAGVSPFGCALFAGDALRLVVNRPVIGGQITLILSWVANAAC